MKIALIADPHLNRTLYQGVMDMEFPKVPFRTADHMRAFRFSIDKCIDEIKPNLIVILGDIFDTFDPSNITRTFFNVQIKKLMKANISTIILVGNHDICSKHNALEPIAAFDFKNVKIVDSPKMVFFEDKILMLFPFSSDVENENIKIRDQFHQFIEESNNKIKENPSMQGKEVLFFGHFGVNGAVKNVYEEASEMNSNILDEAITVVETVRKKKKILNNNNGDITINDLDSIGASYVFLGDYHEHQVLPTTKTIAFYVGSIEKGNFSEIDQEKGFAVYDSEATFCQPLGKCSFVPYNFTRPMIELEGNYDAIVKAMETHKQTIGALVKISFIGSETELMDYSVRLEDLKQSLYKKFRPVYLITKQEVVDEQEQKEASAIEQQILANGHIEDGDVPVVVEEAINEKPFDKEEKIILISMSNQVYKETKEANK